MASLLAPPARQAEFSDHRNAKVLRAFEHEADLAMRAAAAVRQEVVAEAKGGSLFEQSIGASLRDSHPHFMWQTLHLCSLADVHQVPIPLLAGAQHLVIEMPVTAFRQYDTWYQFLKVLGEKAMEARRHVAWTPTIAITMKSYMSLMLLIKLSELFPRTRRLNLSACYPMTREVPGAVRRFLFLQELHLNCWGFEDQKPRDVFDGFRAFRGSILEHVELWHGRHLAPGDAIPLLVLPNMKSVVLHHFVEAATHVPSMYRVAKWKDPWRLEVGGPNDQLETLYLERVFRNTGEVLITPSMKILLGSGYVSEPNPNLHTAFGYKNHAMAPSL